MSTTRTTVRRGRKRVVTEVGETYQIKSERNVSWGGYPCAGQLKLLRDNGDGTYSDMDIPWDDSWEPGSVVDVAVTVTLVKAAPKSRKRCHNPWPAHVCDDGKARNKKRQLAEIARTKRKMSR